MGGGLFETHTVIPYGMCPGHFDLSPGEARVLLEAPLVYFITDMNSLSKTLISGERNSLVSVGIKGNWMVPEIQY